MKVLTFLLVAVILASSAAAQAPQSTAKQMAALNFLIGDWEGDGWITMGPGPKRTFHQTEHVQSKLRGELLLIEGLGHSTEDTSRVVHTALAIISYDPGQSRYHMRAYSTGGKFIDADVTVKDSSYAWSMDDPSAGTIRYTIGLNDKRQWDEVGEASRDKGATWSKFFEMTLDRKK